MWLWCHQVRGAIGMIGRRPDQQNLFSADTQYLDFVGSEVIDQILDPAEPKMWISDCFSAQLKAPAKQRQL